MSAATDVLIHGVINFCKHRVIDGMDTLDTLEKLPVVNSKSYRPTVDTKIKSITIHANPLAA